MIKISFGMIVLNGEPFIEYNLRNLYPFAHQIIIVEGAAPAAKSIANFQGHSNDKTLDSIQKFIKNEDTERKIVLVTAEDEGYLRMVSGLEKRMSKVRRMRKEQPVTIFGRLI